MASGIYKSGHTEIARGMSITSSQLSFVVVTPDYVPEFTEDTVQGDIPEAYQLAEAVLTGKTLDSDNKFLADDTIFSDLIDGDIVGGIVLIRDTGAVGNSPLIAYFTSTDFPLTSNGEPFVVQGSTVDGILAY